MMNIVKDKHLITLSANDIIDLLMEKSIDHDEFKICCKDSALTIFSCLEDSLKLKQKTAA